MKHLTAFILLLHEDKFEVCTFLIKVCLTDMLELARKQVKKSLNETAATWASGGPSRSARRSCSVKRLRPAKENCRR